MTGGQIHGNAPTLSVTSAREAIADALTAIKRSDRLTDIDLGEALGMSPDRARDYRGADADMTAPTFLRGIREWGARFADPALALTGHRLCGTVEPDAGDDRKAPRIMTAAMMKLLAAVEDDGVIDADELRGMAPEIMDVGRLVDALKVRLHRAGRS
jgi:hypothetical protein